MFDYLELAIILVHAISFALLVYLEFARIWINPLKNCQLCPIVVKVQHLSRENYHTCRMMNVASLLFFLVIVSHSSKTFSASTVYVKPYSYEVACPDEPCLTFGDYTSELDTYFISNTTFIFLPGIHKVEFNLRLENVSKMEFRGSMNIWLPTLIGTPKITFSPLVNITWVDSENIKITHLMFILSGTADLHSFFSTLLFWRCVNVRLSKVEFMSESNSTYSTAVRCHTSDMDISNCRFSKCSSFLGAGITIAFCSVVAQDNTFVNNYSCLLYTSPSPRDATLSRMPSSA